jgi:hypothetical protein
MRRTTLLLSEDLLMAVERVARLKGVSRSEVIRAAIAAYAERALSRGTGLPSFTGCGGSDYPGSLGEDAEKILKRQTGRGGWK